MSIEHKPSNFVTVSLTKSSSKDGGYGHTVDVMADSYITESELMAIATKATNTALGTEKLIKLKR